MSDLTLSKCYHLPNEVLSICCCIWTACFCLWIYAVCAGYTRTTVIPHRVTADSMAWILIWTLALIDIYKRHTIQEYRKTKYQ